MRNFLRRIAVQLAPPAGSRCWKGPPAWIIIDVGALTLFGTIMVLSASSVPYVGLKIKVALDYSSWSTIAHQIIWVGIGAVCMGGAALVDPRKVWLRLRRLVPLFAFALLVAVLVFGTKKTGSTRWLPLGFLNLQPSEIAKFAIVLCGASMLSASASLKRSRLRSSRFMQRDPRSLVADAGVFSRGDISWSTDRTHGSEAKQIARWVVTRVRTSSNQVRFLLVAILAGGLVLMEPDLGTATIVLAIAGGMIFLAGARFRWLAGVGGVLVLGLGIVALSVPYQRKRLASFGLFSLFSNHAPSLTEIASKHTQVGDSLAAFASGGVGGLGVGAGGAKWILVNAHTDFILAVIGQETGLIGCGVILAMFAVLAWFGTKASQQAPDRFTQLLAGGITWWIILQAFVNIAATCNLMPVTGIPLPFISFGGTSLVVLMTASGILVSIASLGSPRGVPPEGPAQAEYRKVGAQRRGVHEV